MAQYKHNSVKSGDTILADSWNKLGSKMESLNAAFDEEASTLKGPVAITDELTADTLVVNKQTQLQNAALSGGLSVAQNSTFHANMAILKSRLGVGTQDPKSELEVRGNSLNKLAGTLSVSNFGGSSSATSIDFRVYDTGSTEPTGRVKATGTNWSNKLEIQTKQPGNRNNPLVTRLAIEADGRIGMGTPSPQAAVHIATTSDNALRLQTLDNSWLYTEWYDKDNKRRAWMGLHQNLSEFWLNPQNGTNKVVINAPLQVSGDITYNGRLSKLDTQQQSNATIRVYDLYLGHTSRRGSPGRALVDNKTELVINYGADWSGGTRIDGKLRVTSDLTVSRSLTVGNDLTVNDDATIKGTLVVDGNIHGRMWISGEYTWRQGQAAVRMGPANTTIPVLTWVQGKFEGGGEYVRIYSSGGYWYLGGGSRQSAVTAKARCFGKPF